MTEEIGVNKPYYYNSTSEKCIIGVEATVPFGFSLHMDDKYHRRSEWLGFSHKLHAGDAQCEQSIYLDCDDPYLYDTLNALIHGSPHALQKILELFRSGVKSIYWEHGHLMASMVTARGSNRNVPSWAVWRGKANWDEVPAFLPEKKMVEEVINGLQELKRLLSPAFSKNARSWHYLVLASWFKIAFKVLLCAGISLATIVVISSYFIVDSGRFALVWGESWLLLSALFFAVICVVFKGSSQGYIVFNQFLVLGMCGTLWLSFGAVDCVNVFLDNSPAEIHEQHIIGKRYIRACPQLSKMIVAAA